MNRIVTRRCALSALAMLAILPAAGCWDSSRAHDVDPPRAMEVLKAALEHWKSGHEPGSLPSSPTPMTVQDFDWSGGARLVDYRIIEEGKAYDANLRVRVRLVLDGPANRAGKAGPAEKTVWYLVGTSPSATVFRDSLHR